MKQIHKISLSSNAETVISHIKIKQYDVNSHNFFVQLTDSNTTFIESDTIKAVAYNKNKTLDIIVCSKSTSGQNMTFTLTEACLYYSGTLLIELSVFDNTGKIKWTSPAFVIDVIPSARGNVQNIDIESSLSSELLNIARQVKNKVDIYQGKANASKYLAVGSDGNVTLVDPYENGNIKTANIIYDVVETSNEYETVEKTEVDI